MSLQLRRIGGISEKEHAAGVDGKVAEILNNSDCMEVEGDSSAPSSGPPPLRSSSKGKRPAAKSGDGAGSKPVDRGVGARKRAAANTLGGNIINCWAKATGKPVKWPTPYILLYMWHVLLCTAVCAYFGLRTVHELYCTQFTHRPLHSFCLCTAEFSWVPA